MDEHDAVAWLRRRAGFGFHPGEVDADLAAGPEAVLDAMIDPDGADIPALPDPWADVDLGLGQPDAGTRIDLLDRYLQRLVASRRGLEDWMTFFWHDRFAVQAQVVKAPALLAGHFRLLHRHALGNFGELLREVMTDAAMLRYLDGATSTAVAPNENHARELLELHTLGVGAFDEADVAAGAAALTGWVVDRAGSVRFVPRRHDDTPRPFLGSTAHDVDSVVDAVLEHPACGPFLAAELAVVLLGPGVDPALTQRLGAAFAADGYAIAPLVRGLLEAGLDGAGGEIIDPPLNWYIRVARAAGATIRPGLASRGLAEAGQVPFAPPSVAGWPAGRAWLGSSNLVARLQLAATLAAGADRDGEAWAAATARDHDRLAGLLAVPGGLSATTRAALDALDGPGPNAEVTWLAGVLTAPDLLVV